ncbi:MAG: hypothetical protein ACHQ9S_26560 [Candidatus Binatia bacterium]
MWRLRSALTVAAVVALTVWAHPAAYAADAQDTSPPARSEGGSAAADPSAGKTRGGAETRAEVRRLEKRLEELEGEIHELKDHNAKVQAESSEATQEVKTLQDQVAQQRSPEAFGQLLARFTGSHRFVLTGDFALDYRWEDRTHTNTFGVENFAPIFLYQAGDRLLFEGEVEFKLTNTGSDTPELEYAQADYVLNDYMTLVAGKYILPFGDYLERQHQKWIMKLVDRPLPYRNPDQGGITQDNGVGVQVRGGVPLGYGDGTFADYTVYVANGPSFESEAPGAFLADNHIDNNQGKGYGTRLGFDLLPIAYEMGRGHVAFSTFDGEWDSRNTKVAGQPGDKHWFTSWGISADWQKLPFELRGDYLWTHRAMGQSLPADKREGWYVEASYLLNQLPVDYVNRMELVGRWSGVNQNTIAADDSFTAFSRKPRAAAVGTDYWLAPSAVIKLEYERVMQHDTRDFNQILTSFAYGF